MDAERLKQMKSEASGLKARSALVQKQMFEGLAGTDEQDDKARTFLGDDDVRKALEELKNEPSDEDEMAKKFFIYESYFNGVVELRNDLFGLWERGRQLLKDHEARNM